MTKLYHEKLSSDENSLLAALIHIVISLKRISARSKGFVSLAEEMRENNMTEPYDDSGRLARLYEKTMGCYDNMVEAFKTQDTELINQTMLETDRIESLREEYKSMHLTQASGAGYSVETGIAFSEAARHLARIAHNMKSVVETIPHEESLEEAAEEALDRR